MPNVTDKERIFKTERVEQLVTCKGASLDYQLTGFSTETLQARRDLHKIFNVMKINDPQPRLLHPANLSFRTEGQIKKVPRQEKAEGVQGSS